ncbi:sulfurtransferase [Ornithinibacillus scapharcae]|uniref:sulfurtransferase n=1 Tax=Ornithinibacillus scapharcae TaxID=1147159 RepID=UPI000225C00A|nr:sulfurtransferase [Ornithinibacillus scapharcae]
MSYIITVEKLRKRMKEDSKNLVIVDTRFRLDDPEMGRREYEQDHIPGAVYFDLEKDLSDEAREHGGNHPLPNITTFAEKLGNAGIDQNTMVVVYDKGNDMFAPRFWWLLHYLGHENVYLLEGGYGAWVQAGYSVTDEMTEKKKRIFTPVVRHQEIVDIQEIKENIKKAYATLIDSRSYDRYIGKVEPLYKRAGHIPGAKNYFWMDVVNEDGKWKSKEELEKHFEELDKNSEIIVSCGSGVSATPNIMALKMAGFKHVKLYPGSYSDWISYHENQVETRDETNE